VTRGPVVDIARGERVVADVLDDVKLGGARFFQGLTEAPTSSVGFGAAGIAWFLYRVSLVRGDPGLLALADAWATRIDTADVDGRGFWNGNLGLSREIVGVVAPLHTASGVHCVRALIAHARGDPGTHRRDIRAFLEAVSQPCAGLDLSFGRAGVLVASSLLLDTVADTNGQGGAELLDFTRRMVAEVMAHLESLPTIGREGVVRYLGMAHGWAGMLYAVMRACRSSGAVLPSSLPARLDQLAAHAVSTGREVVWPIVPMPADGGGVSPLFTAGWCRGNAGYVHLWCLAHDTFREPLYLDLAERSALRVWRHEGTDASLCCGLAGRALGLVRLYQHTGDPVWLRRARRLAAKAAKIDHTGSPRPVSLFQGQLGVALAIAELDDPNGATMPLFGAEGWRGSVVR